MDEGKCMLSDGKKLPPLVIFSGKKTPKNPFPSRMIVEATKMLG